MRERVTGGEIIRKNGTTTQERGISLKPPNAQNTKTHATNKYIEGTGTGYRVHAHTHTHLATTRTCVERYSLEMKLSSDTI
jgi:hypothetical protein